MRLTPDLPLPPYSYCSGLYPHPIRDPEGHMYGQAVARPSRPDPDDWPNCQAYLYGIDLFNHGFYWEAHEVWESLWHACGRQGLTANFLKALIKLAAAGVKARERRVAGIQRHAARAGELLRQCSVEQGTDAALFMGLSIEQLARQAEALQCRPPVLPACPAEPVEVLLDIQLRPATPDG